MTPDQHAAATLTGTIAGICLLVATNTSVVLTVTLATFMAAVTAATYTLAWYAHKPLDLDEYEDTEIEEYQPRHSYQRRVSIRSI